MSSCGWIVRGGEGAVIHKFIQRPRLLLSCCSTSKFVLPPWLKLAIVMSMPIVSEKGRNFILRKWLRNGTHCFYSHSTGKNPSFTVTSSFKGGWRMKYLTGRRQKGGRRSFSFKGRERNGSWSSLSQIPSLKSVALWFYCQIPKVSSHSLVSLPLGDGRAVGLSIQAPNLSSPNLPWFYFVLSIGFPHRFPLKKEWAKIFL